MEDGGLLPVGSEGTVARSSDRTRIAEIQRAVCERFQLPMDEFLSASRYRRLARPRQIAMYLATELTNQSLPQIGRRFGGRDHTTVIHAVRTIKALSLSDEDIAWHVRRLRERLAPEVAA